MYGFIYKTTNLINGKIYIGQRRCTGDFRDNSYMGSSITLLADIDKYGKENFQRVIIKKCYSKEELDKWENKFIKIFNPTLSSEIGYNRRFGRGELSEDVKRKIGNANKGKVMSEEARKKISERLKGNKNPSGRIISDKHRETMRKKMKGNKNAVKDK